jgi:glycerol kinase
MGEFILAIDQGTTGSTALVVGKDGVTRARHNVEFAQHFPQPGWVEHDADEIWASVESACREAIRKSGVTENDIVAIGITNQRETTVIWDRATKKPIHRAIVWQDRRTAERCNQLKNEAGIAGAIRERTGLVLDAYFSGTKVEWLLDHVAGARERAERGELAFGTIDSFLVSRLTSAEVHVTDATNASRTLLMDIREGDWSDWLLERFRVPRALLPKIVGSAEIVGRTKGVGFIRDGVPIAGIAGDQQAALFGQACFQKGDVKCTYGTGAFVLMNLGDTPLFSSHGLVTTIAWKIAGKTTYALEGSAFIAGAAVQWLRDGLGIIASAADVEALASSVPSTDGVHFVPALAGLGAPYWDQDARGLISGITRGTTRAHLVRAALEGIAFQVFDLVEAMRRDASVALARLRVDGGAAQNDLLMQMQADLTRVVVERPADLESTARGAALLAGVGAGLLGLDDASRAVRVDRRFECKASASEQAEKLRGWQAAVARARGLPPCG